MSVVELHGLKRHLNSVSKGKKKKISKKSFNRAIEWKKIALKQVEKNFFSLIYLSKETQ